jgi:ribosomal protein S18 acetylase RimI-like enzyme
MAIEPTRFDGVAGAFLPAPRPATLKDVPALVRLENMVFASDQLSVRNFRHLLTKGHDLCLVIDDPGQSGRLLGYVLVLLRRGTSLARLYSLAVAPHAQGRGVGRRLLRTVQAAALTEGAIAMRLEVRPDNTSALTLYHSEGYRTFGRHTNYYADHTDALRLEKLLPEGAQTVDARVPYYRQTTEFTCGPAALMMAMAALTPDAVVLDRSTELRLWREATTIFMTSGPGGCDPYNMAVALRRRGFYPQIHVSEPGPVLLDTVRDPAKRAVMELVQSDALALCGARDIPIFWGALTADGLRAELDAGRLAIALISSYRMYRERSPHWVLVHSYDQRCFYIHDPWVAEADMESDIVKANLPIPFVEFERMSAFGRNRLRVSLVIAAASGPAP